MNEFEPNNQEINNNIDIEDLDIDNNLQEKNKKDKVKSEVISWIKTIAIALILVVIVQNFIIINAEVPTESMVNTIQPGDKLITFRLSYLFSEPKRGDVIVFKYPDNEKEKFTKRVIGLPGEKVEIKDGKVYINDSKNPLKEPYVNGIPTGNYGPYNVPEGSYFVMGDNREKSLDSRFWQNTFVKKKKILGEIKFRYHPNFEWIDKDIKY